MYFFILAIPFIIAWITKFVFHRTITWGEMALQIVVSVAITSLVLVAGLNIDTLDKEIWNGKIVSKQKVRVDCEHSYSCNCVTVGSGDTSIKVCQTCYDHSFDNNWNVKTIIDSFNVPRIDSQGLKEPPRWTDVKIGEPYSKEHIFVNYIKAVPESIFSKQDIKHPLTDKIPDYPSVYDIYRINRVQTIDVNIKGYQYWNNGLSKIAAELGPKKEVNPIIQFVNTDDPTYEHALMEKWNGGKKNDVIVIFGVKNYPKIDFVRIVVWENEQLKHYLRSQLELFDTINDEYTIYALNTIRENIVLHFNRMQMKNYEYLKDDIEPPLWVIILGFIFAVGISILMAWICHKNEIFV